MRLTFVAVIDYENVFTTRFTVCRNLVKLPQYVEIHDGIDFEYMHIVRGNFFHFFVLSFMVNVD